MKLADLHETEDFIAFLRDAIGPSTFKKAADPGRPELTGTRGNKMLPFRTGNQNTPIKDPRKREFFNAPSPQKHLKIGDEEPQFQKKAKVIRTKEKPGTEDPIS